MKTLGILGAGSMAAQTANDAIENGYQVPFFAVSGKDLEKCSPIVLIDGSQPELIPIESPTLGARKTDVVAAVGAPAVKRLLLETWEGTDYGQVIPTSVRSQIDERFHHVGRGVIIRKGCEFTSGKINIGDHTFINANNRLPDGFCTGVCCAIAQRVIIGGRVRLGDGTFIGQGANIRQDAEIGEGAVVAMGAVVMKRRVERLSLVMGNPARKVKTLTDWLDHL